MSSSPNQSKKQGKKKEKEQAKPDPYAYKRTLTDDEKKLIDAMREKLSESDWKERPSPVGDLLRFLVARDNDLEKAWAMYSTHLKWRDEYKPDEITLESISAEAKLRKIRILPADKDGNLTMLLRAANHTPGEFPLDHTLRYAVFMAEKLIKMMPPGQEKFNFLYDRRGFTRKNFDKSLISGIGQLFEANYPERLAHIYVYQSDWLFNILYALVRPFLPTNTVKKIKILDTGDLKGEMLKLFSEENLWHRFGGKWHADEGESSEDDDGERKVIKDTKDKGKDKDKGKKKGKESPKEKEQEKEESSEDEKAEADSGS